MTVIQKLLELHPPTPRERVAQSLADFWERQQARREKQREAQKRNAAPRTRRPTVIPGQTSRAETRMTLNALATHQEIILRERQRDYLRTERDMGLREGTR